MSYEDLSVASLIVNESNDRHGEVGNEDLAIAELFRLHDSKMRNLAADISSVGQVYDAPLVMPVGKTFIVFDGNRRVSCLKLLQDPKRAPTAELRNYFSALAEKSTNLPRQLICQVETDRNLIDAILFRRHTGSQKGIGQLDWNDRAKLNFIERTGQNSGLNIAAEVETLLRGSGRLPSGNIPWSTLTRLLSSEEFRNRVGVSAAGRHFRLISDPGKVVDALHRIASDLASQVVTLGSIWNNEGKRSYLDKLNGEGVLPTEGDRLPTPVDMAIANRLPRKIAKLPTPTQTTLIPKTASRILWSASQQRIKLVWEELQSLNLRDHPNAISALLRILVELSVLSYISEHKLKLDDSLSKKVGCVASHLLSRELIDKGYYEELERIRKNDELISVSSIQRYLHSPNFAPMENELRIYWIRLERFLTAALSR